MIQTFRLATFLAAFAALALSAPAFAYDSSWYKTDFWAGEYPNGFTLKEDMTVKIRKQPLPGAARDIGCAMKKGATYHPWNRERVESDKLEFLSYVKKVTYRIKSESKVLVHDEQADKDKEVAFNPGDKWTYLTYYGEGSFRMQYEGKEYAADQTLFEMSEEKGDREHEEHEWMRLTCANGAQGWLLLSDVVEQPQFERPGFPEYGKAVDKK